MKNNTQKIPFKVSARTARLIGRENIATSKGAIIELVKNAYDADSKVCIVYFDNIYSAVHNEISSAYYNSLLQKGIPESLLEAIYVFSDDVYIISDNASDMEINKFKEQSAQLSSIYIIDAGEGMTQDIIRNNWMIIGTDNKSYNYMTRSGRVKSGAKGIGRFALDKLGRKCNMTTFFNPKYHKTDIDVNGNTTDNIGYQWNVNWDDFEGEFKTIETINAELIGLTQAINDSEIKNILPTICIEQLENKFDFQFGTTLNISGLRDSWDDYYINQVYSDLEVLAPPKESGGFDIYLYSSLEPDKYGEILGSVCDDFDYKVIAKADNEQNIKITVIRNEYDVDLIPSDFFKRPGVMSPPYDLETFRHGKWETQRTFSQLMPGYTETDKDNTFAEIGIFEFSFYYLKKTYFTPDGNRFFYKKFMSNYRKDWLSKFGGIKLFRDNFRVRPYGEVNDIAFDWLGLGNRKATSPAGIAKKGGGYRVEPENVAGAIKISRLTNVNFEDKSSREGLQDNKTFQIFKQLIASIISVFEEDRAYIAREMDEYDNEKYGPERDKKAAHELAQKILEENRRKKKQQEQDVKSNDGEEQSHNQSGIMDTDTEEKTILASRIESQEEEIEKLKSEQKVIRGLASSGIVLASFSHDLGKLSNVMSSRTDKLKSQLKEIVSEDDYSSVESRKNPFATLERIKIQDIKMQNWLNFSIGSTRKDKRKRKQLFLQNYFSDFKNDWVTVLYDKAIDLNIDGVENYEYRIFEIDMDSIFNNLLVNSIDAFKLMKENRKRQISIKSYITQKELVIDYVDNGPGLSKDIDNPEWIYKPMNTTKRNPYTGEEEGTGLGMWLVKSIIEENSGAISLLYLNCGFGVRINFPLKYKK